jgi:hypothetical protein
MGPKELASGAEVNIVLHHSLFFDMMQFPMNNTTCLYLSDSFFLSAVTAHCTIQAS